MSAILANFFLDISPNMLYIEFNKKQFLKLNRREKSMNKDELAKELNVRPWEVDDWLLWGCPASKILMGWEFNIKRVKSWLRTEKIKRKQISRRSRARPQIDKRWFGGRCPVCIDRGFPGEKAGKVYTFGEVSEGKWHFRRTGIPCGHSVYLNSHHLFKALRLGRIH